MKKPRRHKARAHNKASSLANAAHARQPIAPKAVANANKDQAWLWRGTTQANGNNIAGKAKSGRSNSGKPHNPHARRVKGPPPPKPPRKPVAIAPAKPPASKLAPALEARLAAPVLPPAGIALSQLLPARPELRAALVLLLPTFLTATLLAIMPSAKAPLGREPVVAAVTPPVAIPARSVVAALPSLTRIPEATIPARTFAEHDLAGIAPAMQKDAAIDLPPLPQTPHRPSAPMLAAPDTVVVAPASHNIPALASLSSEMPPTRAENESTCRAPVTAVVLSQAGKGAAPQREPSFAQSPSFAAPEHFGHALAAAATAQASDLVVYNARYMRISYPQGDVPALFGVCTDVVIRAYRALNIDLQELVHLSRSGAADTSIDHRRTELLRKFLADHGAQLPVSGYAEDYLPGDIVTYYRPQNKSSTSHIAVVADAIAPSGRPMIVHNRGWGVQLEDALFVDKITGHYRFYGLSATAIAALPRARSIAMAAKPAPTAGVTVAARKPVQRAALALQADAQGGAIDQSGADALLKPRMGLGGPATGAQPAEVAKSAAARTAVGRCDQAQTTSSRGAACRAQTAVEPHP